MNRDRNPTPNALLKRRRLMILLSTLAGVCVGVSADLLGREEVTLGYSAAAMLIWPCMVTCGGGTVALESARYPLFLGGLAFIPGYVVLLLLCRRWPSVWTYVALSLWCAQGFFQLGHRLYATRGV